MLSVDALDTHFAISHFCGAMYRNYPLSKFTCPDFVPEDRDLMTVNRISRILYACFVTAT